MIRRTLSFLLAMGLAPSCIPLTLSREEVIDFDRYPSVLVRVSSGQAVADTEYLAEALRATSGFAEVTTAEGKPTHARLEVYASVNRSVQTDSDGNTDVSFNGLARFNLIDSLGGYSIDSGKVEDTSEFEVDAYEDLLDEIQLHYYRPFRL